MFEIIFSILLMILVLIVMYGYVCAFSQAEINPNHAFIIELINQFLR
jgi:hypothetical protein